MKGRHLVLLVEDEPELAKQIGDTLTLLGHDHVHVTNYEDAMKAIRSRKFCYVLLDLQILGSPTAVAPDVMAGHQLIHDIRDLEPPPTKRNCDSLQILGMSGHAKDHPNVVKAFQAGANDFLTKPLSGNTPPLDDRIRQALERSGRSDHVSCLLKVDGPTKAPTEVRPVRLSITGRIVGARTIVMADDKALEFQTDSLRVLLRFVRARLDGSISVEKKGKDGLKENNVQADAALSRLRVMLRTVLPKGVKPVENVGTGTFSLSSALIVEAIDFEALKVHPSPEVRAEIHKIEQLSAAHGRSAPDLKTS